jgi:hypothetical protein
MRLLAFYKVPDANQIPNFEPLRETLRFSVAPGG